MRQQKRFAHAQIDMLFIQLRLHTENDLEAGSLLLLNREGRNEK